jgi:hypothetical protein
LEELPELCIILEHFIINEHSLMPKYWSPDAMQKISEGRLLINHLDLPSS